MQTGTTTLEGRTALFCKADHSNTLTHLQFQSKIGSRGTLIHVEQMTYTRMFHGNSIYNISLEKTHMPVFKKMCK